MLSCAWAILMSTHTWSNEYNVKLLLDIASLFSLRQLIDAPTRLTCNSAITLDLIFVSSSINVVECGATDAISMSHLIIHATLAIPHRPGRVSVSHNIHAIRPEDIEYELGLIDWSPLYAASHVDKFLTLRPLLLQFLTDSPRLFVGVFLVPPRCG